jgi:aryl-alcohol dehydrogenase-like predicted oxidoreductase
MIHWPDPKVDIRYPMDVLSKLQSKGLIEHLGLCNTNSQDVQKTSEIAKISFLQSEVSLFKKNSFEGFEWKDKIAMGWGTLDKGILSGRVTKERKFSSEDARSWAPWWNKKEVEEKIERVEKLKKILVDYHLSTTEFALHFNLNYFALNTTLVGFKNIEDLRELKSILEKNIPREIIEQVLNRWNS